MCQAGDIPDALSVIHARRSVRAYTQQGIAREILEKILRAGMAAPTAVNLQPWAFIVVTDRAILDRLGDGLPYAKMLRSAPAGIIVCVRPDEAYEGRLEIAVIDGACAAENILLAAQALGLGAVWTAAYPYPDRMACVRDILHIPEGIVPLAVIPLGYPAGTEAPLDKFKPAKIHWEQW